MDISHFFDSILLLLVLFNPLLMSAYLHAVMNQLSGGEFLRVLGRAFFISGCVFLVFAAVGDRLFSDVLQVRFAAFLMFGGVAFLIIALRYLVSGAEMIGKLRGEPEHLAGAIAMPFMIGPGTISASVLIGARLPLVWAALAIAVALAASCLMLMAVKWMFDAVHQRNERLVERYIEIIGRASALIIGTIAVDMILKGIDLWLAEQGDAIARMSL
jgi:multiple antibiotic resistance protein